MTLSLLSFILLLLGTSGAERKIIFGRSRKGSPRKSIQSAQAAEEIATAEVTPRMPIEDSTSNDALSMLLSFEFSMRGTIIPLSLDFSVSIIDPRAILPTLPPSSTDGTVVSTDRFGGIIFEYLGRCTGLDLPKESCLVSRYVENFARIQVPDEGANEQQRDTRTGIIQTSSGIDDECGSPKVVEQELRAVMSMAEMQCTDLGNDIPVEDFDEVVGIFMQLFTNEGCWASLCDCIPSTESGEESRTTTGKDARTHNFATTLFVAAGSAVVTAMLIVMLIAAFHSRRNRTKEAAQDIIGQNYIDGWDEGESTYTAELTCATSCDREFQPSMCYG